MKTNFSGFPPKARSIPVPDLFFSEVLPKIDDMAELKASLHVFWAVFRMKGYPRFITRAALEKDTALSKSLTATGDPAQALADALDLAVEHQILLRLRMTKNGREHEAYLVNDAEGRRAAERLLDQAIERGADAVPEEPLPEKPNIFTLYEEHIGMLTMPIAEELKEAEAQYPEDWIEEAFQIAGEMNVRNWRYVRRILERWGEEGRDSGTVGRSDSQTVGRYIKGQRGPLVPWR